jgi:hypothetical protein
VPKERGVSLNFPLGPFALDGESFTAAPHLLLALNLPLKPDSVAVNDLALEAPIAEKDSAFGASLMVVAAAAETAADADAANGAAPGRTC